MILFQEKDKFQEKEEHVLIPEGVTHLADYLFFNDDVIKTVVLPSTLKSIGRNAFAGCVSLQQIEIPQIYFIGIEAFAGCVQLVFIKGFMRGCCYIGKRAFFGCSSLRELHLTFSPLKVLPFHVFAGCEGLSCIYLPLSLLHVRREAFSGCKSLVEIKFLGGVESLEEESFLNCTSLRTVSFSDSIKKRLILYPHPHAFRGCETLTQLFLSPHVFPNWLYSLVHLKTIYVYDLVHYFKIVDILSGVKGIQICFRDMLKMHNYMSVWKEELMAVCFHPRRLERWLDLGGNLDDF
jgi:hypothetical protein